jgi:DNA polymerase-3 subunit gamma/tau
MVIYNDWRPQEFNDVLGQDNIIPILKSQAITKHYHHSYLLFSPSGSGKTSTARVLAMTLNCDNMNGTGEPCGVCDNCRTIQAGHHWDTIEIDAATHRGIEDIKDLCYKANYSPIGKHKVYIIDECQTLTTEAFNALLRLLEEPPPYLVVIMCTTDYMTTYRDQATGEIRPTGQFSKIPDTITARCQLYPFQKLSDNIIKCKLSRICNSMGLTPDEHAFNNICGSSFGNMRRAENTLEQLCCQLTGAK